MSDQSGKFLSEVGRYYSGRLAEFGPVARGVDWNSEASQELRFDQLMLVCRDPSFPFSLNDLGCGFGSLYDYLRARGRSVDYRGFDICDAMVRAATELHTGSGNARFELGAKPDSVADYTIASGVFNIRLGATDEEWHEHVCRTLSHMAASSRCGFAFNCLTKYSDQDRMRPDLYYADPCRLFDYCKRTFSRQVALMHDYGLFEFTVIVRKDL
jgi:hypothetical protein